MSECGPVADDFERIAQFYLHGPSPDDFIIYYMSRPSDCIKECCKRGPQSCQSFLFFPK